MRTGFSDLLLMKDRTTVVLYVLVGCVCVCGFFLSLLCFHALDVAYLHTIIGNSLSPTARGWSLAQCGEKLCLPRGNLVAHVKDAH